MRHTTPRTQWHYRHADADNLREKVRGLGFGHEPAGDESRPVPPPPPAPTPTAPAPAPPPAGSGRHHGPKLSEADVAEMKRLRAAGWSYKALVERFGVSKSTVHYTVRGVIHRQVPGPEGGAP